MAELRERLPALPGWVEIPIPDGDMRRSALAISSWQRGHACVISGLEDAQLPDKSGIGPQWHISITRIGKRPKPLDVRAALRAFRMVGAEEDNHHPGNARHFWMPVDAEHRVDCECKKDEDLIVDADGYRWTNPTDGSCRGCQIARRLGKVCPLHPQEVALG